jgi:radical SAM protein with 4Fe4S-binding SPASM domain
VVSRNGPTNPLAHLWHTLAQGTSTLFAAPPPPPAPGLYPYPTGGPDEQGRLHLRVEQDGQGVLFVNVSDVVHLNATATDMVKLALDDVPQQQAAALLARRYQGTRRAHLANELAGMYEMVARLRTPGGDCPTCAIAAHRPTQHAPLFSTPPHAPYKVDIALTYGCNNACEHCYNEPQRRTMPSLSRAEWYRVLDVVREVGIPHIIFTGGEATLAPDLPDMVRYADQRGAIVGLNTNGRRLADRAYLDTLVAAGLNHVQVTLASPLAYQHNAITGAQSFEQTVQGIRNAVASPIHTITNTTLTRSNAPHVEMLLDFLDRLGVRTFAMNGMICSGKGACYADALAPEELAPTLVYVRDSAAARGMRFLWYTPTEYCRLSPVELEIGSKRCNAGEYSMAIEPDGSVLPCQSYYQPVGHILHDSWECLWNSDLFRSFRCRTEQPEQAGLPTRCWSCPDLPLCGGGCRLEYARDQTDPRP